MTTYSSAGFVVRFDNDGGSFISAEAVNLVLVDVSESGSASFSYTIPYLDPSPDILPGVHLITGDGVTLGYEDPGAALGYYTLGRYPGVFGDYEIGQLLWRGKTSTVFQYIEEGWEELRLYNFLLGGDPLPEIESLSDLNAFERWISGARPVPESDTLAAGEPIDFSRLPGVSMTEDDRIYVPGGADIDAGPGDDVLLYSGNLATVEGGEGNDRLVIRGEQSWDVTEYQLVSGGVSLGFFIPRFDKIVARGVETFVFDTFVEETFTFDQFRILASAKPLDLRGSDRAERLAGDTGDDRLAALAGNDILEGGDGRDTLNGGDGEDVIFGGATADDLSDLIYAGAGADLANGGYGNDRIFGMDGDDTLLGDFGSDTLVGQNGDDVLSGGALSDQLFGGAGEDFINGGFGFDRLNGGEGADRFFHLGVASHGRDWVQDYSAVDGDVLVFGGAGSASGIDFLVQTANTPGAGTEGVAEAFVTYRPTGSLMWALVDGAAQDHITLQVAGGLSYELSL